MLEAYLDRIKYQGERIPTLNVLQQLQAQHLLSIPFENLDIHLGIPIALDIEKIYDKIVGRQRGGFCYELNGLFCELLRAIGFEVRMIAANIYSQTKEQYGPAYDHLALLVTIDDVEYLTDVGFGAFTFHPLMVPTSEIQEDKNGRFVLNRTKEGYYRVCKFDNDLLVPQYVFQPQAQAFSEFESMCHYQQTSPDSHFTRKKLVSLLTPNGRATITGNVLKINENGVVSERTFEEEELGDLLKQYFNASL